MTGIARWEAAFRRAIASRCRNQISVGIRLYKVFHLGVVSYFSSRKDAKRAKIQTDKLQFFAIFASLREILVG